MEKINPNDPANPRVAFDKDGTLTTFESEFSGMTIRTQIAAMAMQGWISADYTANSGTPHEELAQWSVKMADALIAELNRDV